MSSERRTRSEQGIRPLSKEEIDRRMEELVAEVVAAVTPRNTSHPSARYRWIPWVELVRQMGRFLVYN